VISDMMLLLLSSSPGLTPMLLPSSPSYTPSQAAASVRRCAGLQMKAPARRFQLSDWYGEDWDHKTRDDDPWVSPWAKAHYKLRQQEIEIEQCEFLLKSAIDREDYDEADGLTERADRLRSQHPIIPREQRLEEALKDENYVLAGVFQQDLDAVKSNLGLPKYDVGQAVVHQHRDGLRGIVIDVDLQCVRGRAWVEAAGCLERGCALGYSAEETVLSELKGWVAQPFYTIMPDLTDQLNATAAKHGLWKWAWPAELATWSTHNRDELPAPLYIPEEYLLHDPNDDTPPSHPQIETYFEGYDSSPHRGRTYRPAPKLRLWQQQRAAEQQDLSRRRTSFSVSSKNPYDMMK